MPTVPLIYGRRAEHIKKIEEIYNVHIRVRGIPWI